MVNLFRRREDSIISDVIALELKIKLQASLLGAKNNDEATSLLNREVEGGDLFFISDRKDLQRAIFKNQALTPEQKLQLQNDVEEANYQSKVGYLAGGVFLPFHRPIYKSLY